MKRISIGVILMMCMATFLGRIEGRMLPPHDGGIRTDTVASVRDNVISFKKDVTPIIAKYCLPCHAEDNYNPSELSLDTYSDLMQGGKHGKPVVPGDSKESAIVKKLGPNPPFGHPMPLKKRRDPEQKFLLPEQIQIIRRWIDEGAKDN